METFLHNWGEAALTSLGFFWMALWAFCLGYVISSTIQVFVTEERMQRTMGTTGPRSVALGTFFGFISSSCSFAALSTTRALFQKGAGLVPALAFLLASTNLVVELGILIFIFLTWQFVVGEYLGGVLLILIMWGIVRLTLPRRLLDAGRDHARAAAGHESDDGDPPDWRRLVRTRRGWTQVGRQYFMEWRMVWKDVLFGFTVAGAIAAFVPSSFFQALFVGSGPESDPAWWQIALQTLIGPVAAFFTFIGSMGNIPLAAVLFGSGVSFAGVMAFIFSDLVVFPVLRISVRYFGRAMALYILGVFLVSLVTTAIILHAGFDALGLMPDPESARMVRVQPDEQFRVDDTLFLNAAFLVVSLVFVWLTRSNGSHEHDDHDGHDHHGHHHHGGRDSGWMKCVLQVLAVVSTAWLVIGVVLWVVSGPG